MEIGTYVETFINDELLGNIIDLCPVGALTSMPYAFSARSWELKKFKSIDILDALGSSIRVDIINNNISRIVPYMDEIVNEEWISNKARFSYDALMVNRINFPQILIYGKFIVISLYTAVCLFLRMFYKYRFLWVDIICGSFLTLETMISLKTYFNNCGCSNINFYNINLYINDLRFFYLLNTTLIKLEGLSNILFLGTNVRLEAPLLNLRLRKAFLGNFDFKAYSIGLSLNYLTYPVKNIAIQQDL